jgi:hypothetical protein
LRLRDLMKRLDELSWAEQVEFEATERGMRSEQASIDRDVRRLAAQVTPELLAALARQPGYEKWVRRLRSLIAAAE